MTHISVLQKIVFSNLDSAAENGAFEAPDGYLYDATPAAIANDMIALADDCNDFAMDQIVGFVGEWLLKRAGKSS